MHGLSDAACYIWVDAGVHGMIFKCNSKQPTWSPALDNNSRTEPNLPVKMSDRQSLDGREDKKSWAAFFKEEVSADWGDLVLIVGCFATGLLDAAIFNVWQCFVSMQTGKLLRVWIKIVRSVPGPGLKAKVQAIQYTSVLAFPASPTPSTGGG